MKNKQASMQDPTALKFFATAPKGLELLLAEELRQLGAGTAAEKLAGVAFTGDLALAYKACLWSRLANRILLPLKTLPAATPEALYTGIQMIDWTDHLDCSGTFAIHCVCSQSTINHSLFAAQKIKDAIVDQFRQRFGIRPSVARVKPEVSIHAYLHRDEAIISIDLSGESLHKRGYRLAGGLAPLKENLAAALLLRAGWIDIAKAGGSLLDPMCGSGTLLIEAALLASNTPPGLFRNYFGFLGWKKHQPLLWQSILEEAKKNQVQSLLKLPAIVGYDNDKQAIKIAHENINRIGLSSKIHVEKRELSALTKLNKQPGLLITNPPYGERIGEINELQSVYRLLGERLKEFFCGWKAAVFTGNSDLGKQMGIRAKRYYALPNGTIPCKLLLFDVEPVFFVDRSPEADNERRIRHAKRECQDMPGPHVQMFVNRIRKKLRHLRRHISRSDIAQIRIYDADLPEYAFTIDVASTSAFVREYKAPKTINENKVIRRRQEVLSVLPELLNLPPAQIFFSIIDD